MKIKSLKWPPKNNNATIECNKASQPKENWNIIKYSRLLGPFGTYDEARAVEISAVDISTNDEEALVGIINNSQQLPKKRIVKKPSRLHSFFDEDDNDDEPILKNSVKKNVVPVIPDPPKSYKPHIINDRKIEASTGAEKRDLTKSSDHKKIGNAQKDNMKQNNDNNNDFCNESFVYDDQPLDYGDYLSDYSLEPIEEISEIETTVKPVHEHTDKNLKPQKHVNMKKNITLQLKNTDTYRLQYNQNLSILPDKPKIRSVVNTNIPIRIATYTAKKEQEETLQFQDDSDSSKQIPTTDI